MEILPEIKNRKSPTVFKSDDVEKEKIEACIEAARWAPSCFNKQPWNYVLVHKSDASRKDFEAALSLGNGWAAKAPYLVAVSSNPTDGCKMNDIEYATYDTGLSVMNFTTEAVHQKLATHQMAGFNPKKVKKALNISEGQKVIVVFAVGYPDDPKKIWDKLSEKIRERITQPRERKPTDTNFFFGKFGN